LISVLAGSMNNSSRLIGLLVFVSATLGCRIGSSQDFHRTCVKVWPKVVKIFGAGGIKRLHSYSSGIIISSSGHILTVWNHVLETDQLRVVLSDGQRFDARLQLVDTSLEAAIIKIDSEDLPFYDLQSTPGAQPGQWVLGFSNAYKIALGNEKPTVMHGVLSAMTDLRARKGVFEVSYSGPVLVVDGIMNNPGSGGGALTDRDGRLLGMIGKELRSVTTNIWLNFAIPADELKEFVRKGLAGETIIPVNQSIARPVVGLKVAGRHGIRLVPDVLEHTPAYVDVVKAESPADRSGLHSDDLILFLDDTFIGTCRNFTKAMSEYRPGEKVTILLKRGNELVRLDMKLK